MATKKYFTGAFALTGAGVLLGVVLGWLRTGTAAGALSAGFIVAVLGAMEISLSFDNAVVNATILRGMDERWRRRFLTWGIAIAVVGMRLVFPLAIVAIAAHLGPWEALRLAISRPDEYATILSGSRFGIAAFGGAFLLMVALSHFFDQDKDVHWIGPVERSLSRLGRLEAVQVGITLLAIYGTSLLLGPNGPTFLTAGTLGVVTFIAVEALGTLTGGGESADGAIRTGAAAFIYLEFLDASFSFDGVIGAFALSNNLFIIAAGLGIGAAYVRSMTLFLVEKETLATYPYLESGAFWAILALACIMLAQTVVHIPEVVTGLIGAAFIGAALLSSQHHNRLQALRVKAQIEAEVTADTDVITRAA